MTAGTGHHRTRFAVEWPGIWGFRWAR